MKIKCKGNHNVSLKDLKILQDTDNFTLKELSEKNYQRIKQSLVDNGFLFPFFGWWSEEEKVWLVVDGTQRLKTLLRLSEEGMTLPKTFPLVQVLAEDKKEAARAILLQSSRYGKITQEGFDGFLQEFDLTGEWLDTLDFPEVLTWEDPSEIKPELSDSIDEIEGNCEKKVALGETWQLGRHKLYCGDCTKEKSLKALIGKDEPFVLTDPPYGISIVGKDGTIGRSGKVGVNNTTFKKIEGDKTTKAARAFYELSVKLGVKDFILFGGNYFLDFLPSTDGFSWLVWDKREDYKNRNDFADGEMAWFSKHTALRIYRQLWKGFLVDGEERGQKRMHPTQKPVRMLTEIIQDHIPEDRIILDAFAGSGSILIAAEKTGRACYASEIDPEYCDVIIARFEKETGEKAVKI